jgi:hypothetical protein
MSTKDKAPPPMAVKTEKGLRPARAWDAEALSADALNTEYELVKVTRRKPKQHRTYWRALNLVVKGGASNRWPTAEHLHDELKLAAGFYRKAANLATGEIMLIPDSTAFDKMGQDEWQVYMDRAMELIAQECGIDPLAWLEAA